jgi:tRNA threonylcarbamoyladenosine biosynthesis protein TsaE
MHNVNEIVFEDLSLDKYKITASQLIALFPNERIFAFIGDLGAGKTTFIKELCASFDIEPELVSSPTFSIINEYLSPKLNAELYHMDFYRIEDESEAEEIDLYDYLDSGKYCFIEWPSQIKNLLPENYVQVEIKVKRDQTRSFRIFRYGRRI